MLAYDLEFGPNTAEAHKKVIYGMFPPKYLLNAYRTARREHNSADLALVCRNMDPNELFAGPRASMSSYLQSLKFPAPLVSAQSYTKLPSDHDAFWLIIPMRNEIPIMVVLYALAYESVPEGQSLIGEA